MICQSAAYKPLADMISAVVVLLPICRNDLLADLLTTAKAPIADHGSIIQPCLAIP